MSDDDKYIADKFVEALKSLKVTDWKFEGADPTTETEFLAGFKKVIGADDSGGSVYTNDASKFGITWTQIKTEMDKL